MSVEQLESQVLALPLAERRAFTRWLDEHRDEIEQPSALTGAQQIEVQKRLAEGRAVGNALRAELVAGWKSSVRSFFSLCHSS